ncbi:MAG: hypothetical protein Q9191_004005 [Dirinaria sp. TL-2023a]
MPPPTALVVPMTLDAFVFNQKVCDASSVQAKIAPITQPNYTFLRLRDHLAQNDIVDHVDLHSSIPPIRNPRLTDIGKGLVRKNRLGVYVHWSVPRPLRSGVTSTSNKRSKSSNTGADADPEGAGPNAPRFHPLPNRWLVIRVLDPEATVPKNVVGPVRSWVIESDKIQNIDNIPETMDLQVDFAPFITSFIEKDKTANKISVDQQAEIFIGQCMDANEWKESANPNEPRVGLSAASSSNQLFMDYQYHNSNVFSMLDTFTYEQDGGQKCLTSAKANYYVIGWRDGKDKDILSQDTVSKLRADLEVVSREKQIEDLGMAINKSIPAADKTLIDDWLRDDASGRSLCHGTLYDVEWNSESRPQNVLADDFGLTLDAGNSIAVGTTPINSILAYISGTDPNPEIEDSIYQLQAYLRAEDDSIDAYMAAADEVQCTNYAHFDGGTQFALPGTTGGKANTGEDRDKWGAVNSAQKLKDATLRRMQQLRWEIFAWWWKYISDVDNVDKGRTPWYKEQTQVPKDELTLLKKFLSKLDLLVGQPSPPIKSVVMEDFHQREDPTLLLTHCESAWPRDFDKALKVRLNNQLVGDLEKEPPLGSNLHCLPPELREAGKNLFNEFSELLTKSSFTNPKPQDAVLPLYHDGKTPSEDVSTDNPWRDRWGSSQPWFPLYLEWDAEYVHIPADAWSFVQRPGRSTSHIAPKYSYTLKRDVRYPKKEDEDIRSASGRSLLLPQPSFSLRAHFERLFSTIPEPQLDKALSKDRRTRLLANVDKLGFLSVSLDGLTEHLTTLYKGSHVKPLVRPPGGAPVVLDEAAVLGSEIGLSNADMRMIGQESDPTPYGSLASLVGAKKNAFKPVTHGQLRFTKLNVVDKFGQVVHAIDPIAEDPGPIYPHVSQEYAIDAVPALPGEPNVVDPSRSTLDEPEFIQLPPSINQPSRINGHFVVHGPGKDGESYWRPISDWDNPIWGWVVVNYADLGLQFFLQDGTFYREVQITSGTANDVKWLPFESKRADLPSTKQLDWLIIELTKDKNYLKAFMDMIMTALSNTVPVPTAFAQFMNALVGKPLALANMGWSLELSTKYKTNESTIQQQVDATLPWGLLDEGQKQYEFPIKFGDKARNYDGLVGYFDTPRDLEGKTIPSDPENEKDLVLNKIYTYFHEKAPLNGQPLTEINENTCPKFRCFWRDPKDYATSDEKSIEKVVAQHEIDRNGEFQVFGAIFDPFSPITGFSSILPIRTVKLPNWTWESALKKMTSFFHAGPIVVTDDIPDFDKSKELAQDNYMEKFVANGQIAIPSMNIADWAWLQPYDLRTYQEDMSYVGMEVGGEVDQRPKWVKGPLTAVEGFMQLRAPLEQEKQGNAS